MKRWVRLMYLRWTWRGRGSVRYNPFGQGFVIYTAEEELWTT